MKYIAKIFIGILACIMLSGCDNKEDETIHSEMAEVVFVYYVYDTSAENMFDEWFIDSEGNVFYTDNMECYSSYEELMEKAMAARTSADGDLQLVETIDKELVEEKFLVLQQLINSDTNWMTSEVSFLDVCLPERGWGAYYYDEEGNIKVVTLHREGSTREINVDETARELSNWISEVIGVEGAPYGITDSEKRKNSEEEDIPFKKPKEKDIVVDEDTGAIYVKNQLIIDGMSGYTMETMENVARQMDAKVIGYNKIANDYQIQFKKDKSKEELLDAACEIHGRYGHVISDVRLNIIEE